MTTDPSYDPDADLAEQRPKGGIRAALGFMLAASVCELGGFLQTVTSIGIAPTWLQIWIVAKLPLALLGLWAVISASRMRERAFELWSVAAIAVTLESGAFFVVTLAHGLFSCFSALGILPAMVTTFAILPLRAAAERAREARERLAHYGIDVGF